MFKKVLFIGSVLLLASLVIACGQPALNLPAPVLPPAQPPTITESPLPAQPPPADEAVTGEEWNKVETFIGQGNETTPPFHISGIKWRITWTTDAEYPEYAVFSLFIHPEDMPGIPTERISHSGGSASDTTYIYEGGHDYYIKVIAANLRSWAITVEDYAAETKAPVSPIQITNIHYKGTFHPRDPENCVCFERVEPDEYVVIKNLGNCHQEISGWVLKNISKGYPSFTFPPGLVLYPGEIIRVYTDEIYPECETWQEFGAKAPYSTDFTNVWFTFYYGPGDIWNDEIPDIAVLYNAEGEEVSRKTYAVPAKE